MRDFLEKKQHIVVRGLLQRAGKILVVRNAYTDVHLEYYQLPGGVVSFGDDPIRTLEQLFYDQTNVSVTVVQPYRTTSHVSRYGDEHTVEVIYMVEAQAPQLRNMYTHDILWVRHGERGYFLSERIGDSVSNDGTGTRNSQISLPHRFWRWLQRTVFKRRY